MNEKNKTDEKNKNIAKAYGATDETIHKAVEKGFNTIYPDSDQQPLKSLRKKGERSTCETCRDEIEYDGKQWNHMGYKPTHEATPKLVTES